MAFTFHSVPGDTPGFVEDYPKLGYLLSEIIVGSLS